MKLLYPQLLFKKLERGHTWWTFASTDSCQHLIYVWAPDIRTCWARVEFRLCNITRYLKLPFVQGLLYLTTADMGYSFCRLCTMMIELVQYGWPGVNLKKKK